MPVLHMQTEYVNETAVHIQRTASRVESQTQELRSAVYRLQSVWEGTSQYDFTADMTRLLQSFDSSADNATTLSQRLQTEVNEWLQTDSIFSGGQTTTVLLDELTEWSGGVSSEAFSWLGWSSASISLLGAVLQADVIDWKKVGRGMNWLIDNQRGGWVGHMDEFGNFISNNKLVGAAFEGIPLGLDIWASSSEEGWSKAIGSESIEFLFEKGMYALPVVGQIYMAYDVALEVASVAAGGLEILGFEEEAIWLQNTVDQLDIGEHIGDWGYDFLANNVAPNLDDAAGAVVDFGAGFVEGVGDLIGGASEAIWEIF